MKRRPQATEHASAPNQVPARPYVRWAALTGFLLLAVLIAPRVLAFGLPASVKWGAMVATASVTSVLLDAAGIPATLADGNLLYLTNHVFRIDPGCTAASWLLLYAIAVVSMPVARSRKIQGLIVGLPSLIVFNLLRLVLVAAVSEYRPASFDVIHDIVMQSSFAVFTALLWAGWMWVSRDDWKPGWE